MTCEPCARALTVRHYEYISGCQGCSARAIAESPAFFESEQAGTMTRVYRTALMTFFGADLKAAHERVKAAAAQIRAIKVPA